MKLHADVRAIRASAPKGYPWLCIRYEFSGQASAYWQRERGNGNLWEHGGLCDCFYIGEVDIDFSAAINVISGNVHVLSRTLGNPVVVPQSAWVAARKRKGRK